HHTLCALSPPHHHSFPSFSSSLLPPPPPSPLFPYTTLFRSPPARRPTASIFCPWRSRSSDCRSASSVRFRSIPTATALGIERKRDRKSTRLNSSHQIISYAVFCLKKKTKHSNHSIREHNHFL